ncbi:MAG: hypothetical protein ABL898_02190 [Hyphomicrobiaceae bacterium]|nr:hypothetical protein [Hyphomicrobiaceae bacterium]
MRSPDFIAMLLAMLAVPVASWLVGSFTGRRNWSVAVMLLLSGLASALIQVGLLFDFSTATTVVRPGPARDFMIGWPEYFGFLLVFGAFIALLGWSSTPVRAAPSP